MKCIHCGMQTPFAGDTCPFCLKPKAGSQAAYIGVYVGGIPGAILGYFIGKAMDEDIGEMVGAVVGAVVGAIIGAVWLTNRLGASSQNARAPTSHIQSHPNAAPKLRFKQKPQAVEFKCPHCGAVLEGDISMASQVLSCPSCSGTIKVKL